jgi:hypothetical protein
MSTRSLIGIENEDGSVRAIWCATDGYLSWNGRLLLEHYNSAGLAKQIIALGALYHLDQKVIDERLIYQEEYAAWQAEGKKWTIHGKPSWDGPRVFKSVRELEEEFVYVFRCGMWWVFEGDGWLYMRPLHEVVADCKRYGVRGFEEAV